MSGREPPPGRGTAPGVGTRGGSQNLLQGDEPKTHISGPPESNPLISDPDHYVLHRDPEIAAAELAQQCGGRTFAFRWAQALLRAAT